MSQRASVNTIICRSITHCSGGRFLWVCGSGTLFLLERHENNCVNTPTCRNKLAEAGGSVMCVCRLSAGCWRSGARASELLKLSANLGPIIHRNRTKWTCAMRSMCRQFMRWQWNKSEVAQSPPLAPFYQLKIKQSLRFWREKPFCSHWSNISLNFSDSIRGLKIDFTHL